MQDDATRPDNMPSQLSSISVSTPAAPRWRRERAPSAVVVIVSGVLVTFGLLLWLRGGWLHARAVDPVAAGSSRAVTASTAPAASSGPATSGDPSRVAAPNAADASMFAAAASAPAPPSPTAAPKRRPSARPDCNPPYTVDATGQLTFKRNCL
jgi:hypothetical protein